MRPVLRKVQADQLIQIEKNSPHIELRSQEIWKFFIRRDFQDKGIQAIESINSCAPKEEEDHNQSPHERKAEEETQVDYRKLYKKLAADRKKHLEKASNRLKANLEQFNKDRDYWKITELAVDPKAIRSHARRKLGPTAPVGSKLLQKTIQHTLDHGPSIFSPRNIRFVGKPDLNASKRVIRPPRSLISLNPDRGGPNKRKFSVSQLQPQDQQNERKKFPKTQLTTSQKMFNFKQPPSSPPSNPTAFPALPLDIKYKIASTKVKSSEVSTTGGNDHQLSSASPPPKAPLTPAPSATSKRVITRPRKTPSIFITKR